MSPPPRPTRAAELLQALRRRLSEREAVPAHAPVSLDIDLDQLALQALRQTFEVETSPAVLQVRPVQVDPSPAE